jgi:hypothetical protein
MRSVFKFVLDGLRKPEWVASIALLIQAVILGLQARILTRHGKTMEEHAGIAKAQAATAELIGKALNQQEKILADQTRIMDEQFKFQRRVEVQAGRRKIYEALFEVHQTLMTIIQVSDTGDGFRERNAWGNFIKSIIPCQKEVLTTIHLSDGERQYFKNYLGALIDVIPSDGVGPVNELKGVVAKHSDFMKRLTEVSQTPAS